MLAVRAQIVCIAQHTRYRIIIVRPADIAPTLPELMELPKPKDMTGHSLLRAE